MTKKIKLQRVPIEIIGIIGLILAGFAVVYGVGFLHVKTFGADAYDVHPTVWFNIRGWLSLIYLVLVSLFFLIKK